MLQIREDHGPCFNPYDLENNLINMEGICNMVKVENNSFLLLGVTTVLLKKHHLKKPGVSAALFQAEVQKVRSTYIISDTIHMLGPDHMA